MNTSERIRQLARQESDDRTLIPARNLPWGRVNAREYLTGILNPAGLPQATQAVIQKEHLDPRDFLYSTTTASSVWVTDTARLRHTFSFLDNTEKTNRYDKRHARYLVHVQNHIRQEISNFLQLGTDGKDRILLDHSGTHSALSLRQMFPDAAVIMTTEVGRSLKIAYEGRHPFSSDIHTGSVAKNDFVTGTGGKVYEVPIREGKNGSPRPEKTIRDAFLETIKEEARKGRKTILVHVPLPPKTGVNPKERIEWLKELRDKKSLLKHLGIRNEQDLPRVIVLGDMAQTRFLYGTDRRGNVYDPTKSNRDGGFCDVAMFASSKSIGGMPLTGILVMNRDVAEMAKKSVAKWNPSYVEHYTNIGQLPDSWRAHGEANYALRSIINPACIRGKSLVAADALTARLLSAGDMLSTMKRLGVENGQQNFKSIKETWDSIVAGKKGLARVYKDVSDKNTPSTFSYQLENVNAREDAYPLAQTIRRMMLTPFSQEALDAVKDWGLTDRQMDAMKLLFETGFPVSEEAAGLQGKHKPILRIGLGWLQAIDWSKTNLFHPDKSRRKQITKALDFLATKLEVLATHADQLQRLEPYAVQVANS